MIRSAALWKRNRVDIRYYDIGINLFSEQFKDREAIIREAEEAGVACIITGSDMESTRLTDEFTRSHEVWGTAGIHPHAADRAQDKDFDEIKDMLTSNPKMIAVGECGLDFNRMFSEKNNQIKCLERHIGLAEELEMPMFLHERDASETFYEIFSGHRDVCPRSVVHCFTGTAETAKKYLELGFSIGITGWICDDRRAADVREAVKYIPADRLLVETDAPYLAPRNVKGLGRVNHPRNIQYVARALAEYKQMDAVILAEILKRNTERLFGIGS